MNILFITHYDDFYGASRSLMSLIQGLKEKDITPFVVLPRTNRFSDSLTEQNVKFTTTGIPYWVYKRELSLYEKFRVLIKIILSIGSLIKTCNEWKIDLIYTNSSVTPVGRLAAWVVGKPHIWHIREFADLHFGLKFIFSPLLSKSLIDSSNAVIFNSGTLRDHFSQNTSRANHYAISNGVTKKNEFSTLLETKKSIVRNGVFTFLIAGAITPKKGQDQSIRAVAELQNCGYKCRLLVAGDGARDYQNRLAQLSVDLGIQDEVIFLGFVEDPNDAYKQADCLLVCSENEAFGRVTAEGMSMGLPVIAKNSGGTPEIVENGKTGILYDDFNGLVSAMKAIIDNPDWGKSLGLAGWNRAKENFSIEDYVNNIYSVIQFAMERK